MNNTRKKFRVGELRPSQVLFTYGIGAVVDLPFISTMVMGLEDWINPHPQPIGEERLLQAVKSILGVQVSRLLSPPVAPEQEGIPNPFDESATIGVPVAAFPRWMLCPRCRTLAPLDSSLFQLKVDNYRADRTRYVHVNCPSAGSPPPVVPARFLVACKAGHLDDFPWLYFVHGEAPCQARLKLVQLGVSGEAVDVQVKCETCGKQKRMGEAFGKDAALNLPACNGRHPHLRTYESTPCEERSRTILLGASNSWFPILLSALAVPNAIDKLGQLVDDHWHILEKVENQQNIDLLKQLEVLQHFATYTTEEIWEKIEQRKYQSSDEDSQAPSLKTPEWQVLSNPKAAPDARDFKVTAVPLPAGYEAYLEQVVLVERLREVRALIGFTRIEAPGDFSEMLEVPENRRAPISRKPTPWVPAAEVRGEGIFIQFREDALQKWLNDSICYRHYRAFKEAHIQYRRARRMEIPEAGYPGLRYVLLHSFAHALMRQFTLECGYTAASIRERIYSLPSEHEYGPMAGILFYTSAPDSEGTLGGLVGLGVPEQLERHLDGALEQMQSCTSDPLCAEHTCSQEHSLHEAACHACLFLPETSCERGNKYLDRSVLVPTVNRADLAFFDNLH
ncbi:MAG TPA: DUF1998 domain-containing protein [Ktedonobacteraceae bacterium]|nr:DUF1998 domain-containing protein [Ktedonobacteraceae bacterium]